MIIKLSNKVEEDFDFRRGVIEEQKKRKKRTNVGLAASSLPTAVGVGVGMTHMLDGKTEMLQRAKAAKLPIQLLEADPRIKKGRNIAIASTLPMAFLAGKSLTHKRNVDIIEKGMERKFDMERYKKDGTKKLRG